MSSAVVQFYVVCVDFRYAVPCDGFAESHGGLVFRFCAVKKGVRFPAVDHRADQHNPLRRWSLGRQFDNRHPFAPIRVKDIPLYENSE